MPELHCLVETGNLSRLRDLLGYGGNPDIQDGFANTPLHVAAFKVPETKQDCDDNLQVARVLIRYEANVDQTNSLGNTPLHFAVARRNYKMIKILLQAKAQIDLKDNYGNSGLHYAINNCALLKMLNEEYICPDGHLCSDWKTVKQLLKFHLDVNASNNSEETPLMWAVKAGNLRIVKELLQKGAAPNTLDVHFNTVLHFAIDKPKINVDIVQELIRHGCDPGLRNKSSLSSLDIYLARYQYAKRAERRKAHFILKHFLLNGNLLSETENVLVYRCLLKVVSFCHREILRMRRDMITYHYSIYDIIIQNRGDRPLSPENLYKLLAKLLTGKYPLYSDFIASCFSRSYLSRKFAEICWWVERNNVRNEFLNYDMRFWLSYYYLSPFDMYIMMFSGK